jgi:hypothetical protein
MIAYCGMLSEMLKVVVAEEGRAQRALAEIQFLEVCLSIVFSFYPFAMMLLHLF